MKAVLRHKNQLTGIVGAVAELIEVPKEYTLAIETALGGAAQHIVVKMRRWSSRHHLLKTTTQWPSNLFTIDYH